MKLFGSTEKSPVLFKTSDQWECRGKNSPLNDAFYTLEQYHNLYKNDNLIQQAIHIPIEDAFSDFVTFKDNNIQNESERLKLQELIIEYAAKARLEGDYLLVPIITYKGRSKRLNIGLKTSLQSILDNKRYSDIRLEKLSFVQLRQELAPDIIENINSPFFGKTEYFNEGQIHRSRAVIVKGSYSGESFLKGIYNYYQGFCDIYAELSTAVAEANVTIVKTNFGKLKDWFIAKIKMGQEISETKQDKILSAKAREFRQDMVKSKLRMIDQHESVENKAIMNINDMVNALDAYARYLTAAVDIQPSRFIAVNSSRGLSSLNKGEIVNTIQSLTSIRNRVGNPVIHYVADVIGNIQSIENRKYDWQDLSIKQYLQLL